MVDVITIIAVIVSVASSTASLAYWLGRRFTEIESRFGHVDSRLGQIEDRFNKIENRINVIEGKINGVEERVNRIEERIGKVEERIINIENRIEKIENGLSGIEDRVSKIEDRINRIEDRINKIEDRISNIENRISGVENRINSLEIRIERLENAFKQFSEVLITALESKGIFTSTEALTLRSMVKTLLPVPRTKYYTWEVYERLRQLLDKDPNEYTMADIEQLNDIADLIEKEGFETKRRDLIEYAWKLRYYAMVAKVVFVYPKLRQQK
ncbi:tropomyosin [Vulcanisaeta souniana]|uniref:Uncharacterized protein n=1 Tax=Vulcanisaeta souniana JCM 11219 TaxID=1293586 RepID=A0A830EHC5_9CREN|nr:tropomyosin [Vulcanisaeta souniana]BDR91643.1 hypothetical protein Vsou_07360 [Vulcanisaeta souniana JCM 11219]GGI71661.1 hypothetical protein GCM10007112_05570 [Vulcanisaeta souniana JCM 11219]